MKGILFFVLASLLCFLFSCNPQVPVKQGTEAVEKLPPRLELQTRDVKGTVEAPGGASVYSGTLMTNEGSFEEAIVKLDPKANISIYPTAGSFEALKNTLIQKLRNWGSFDTLDCKPNSLFYHTKNESDVAKEDGYNFLVVIPGKTKNYIITSEGEAPLKPISDQALAERAYKMALSFKATE